VDGPQGGLDHGQREVIFERVPMQRGGCASHSAALFVFR